MKSVLCFLLVLAPISSLVAQGMIVYGNVIGTTIRAPVYGPDPGDPFNPKLGNTPGGMPAGTQTYGGAPLAGTGYTVALFTLAGDNYVELGRTVFRTGSASGFFFQRTVLDPNHPPGSTGVTAVVRAWDNQGGTITNWDQAAASIGTPIGQSAPMTLGPLGGVDEYGEIFIQPTTSGIRSFNLYHRGGAFIVGQPVDVVVPAGASAHMHVDVASDVGAPSYQWQREGVDVPSATGATLQFANIQYGDAGGYTAVIAASSITLTSRVARLTVQPRITGIEHFYIPEWGADAVRLTYDSTPLHPVRVEVRSTLIDTWINMGQYVNPNVQSFFFDIGPTNDMRFYRLSIDP